MDGEINRNIKYNLAVNLLDGGFFGFALGFASFVTVIPLFVSSLTESPLLIGLIPAIHSVGWQFPQLFTARKVSQQTRLKPMVVLLTINERLPFFFLAVIAWYSPILGVKTTLVLTFLMLIWQGLGGGFTANAWQTMIGKIFPAEMRGTFFGAQSSAANLMASISAIFAGLILQRLASPGDFTLSFLLCSLAMIISWFFLVSTREPEKAPPPEVFQANFSKELRIILRQDRNFRWFLVVRMLSQLAVIGQAFYTVYAVKYLGMSELAVGILTSVLLATQILANPAMGWLGDRWSYRWVMLFGIIASIFSGALAWQAPHSGWFFPVVILAGIANVSLWTISMAMNQEFGQESQRPVYIGMANTLTAPFTILAPFIGGWLAEQRGYPLTFLVSAVFGCLTAVILIWLVKEPGSPDRVGQGAPG